MSHRGLGALATLVERSASGRTATIDRSVLADLDPARLGIDLPAGLELTWLGTAGFRLHMDGTTLLIDPFVTRRSLPETFGNRTFLSDTALADRLLPVADAVLVGHCHFDHAVDVPHLAARGATVYGSTSVGSLLDLHGLGARAVRVDPAATYEIGPFTVRFVPSRHSKLVLGLAVPSDGELTCDSLDGLGSSAYRCGQVWAIHIEVAGTTILHQGSAELDEDHYTLGPVDLLLSCIAGRYATPRFVERTVRAFRPTTVVPHHLDDFFRPLDAPMGLSFNVRAASFVEDLERVDPDVEIRALEPLRAYRRCPPARGLRSAT